MYSYYRYFCFFCIFSPRKSNIQQVIYDTEYNLLPVEEYNIQ